MAMQTRLHLAHSVLYTFRGVAFALAVPSGMGCIVTGSDYLPVSANVRGRL
ncbi:hypothetical protein [Microbulbifer guangxiensis]|uniref:hypothetical protein n=1 Tax=Microbulbifer guangxiensis TaxID=2904249 RepID=UPI001F38F9F8|nr:hypothetical protein [Microbulbifer guangxiensis]